MVVCSKCGNHYNEEFLQCPQCGSSKRITEAEEKNNNSVIGFLITLAIVLALVGIIGYGVYYYLNPVSEGSATSDLDPNLFPTEPTTVANTKETTTTTIQVKSTTTTTKLIGTEGTPLGTNHTFTMPEGYTLYNPSQEQLAKNNLTDTDGVACITNNVSVYCITIVENGNMSVNSSNKEEINSRLHEQGFSDMITTRLYGNQYYYFYKITDGNLDGGLYRNKGTNMLFGSFQTPGEKVDEESMATLVSILASIK